MSHSACDAEDQHSFESADQAPGRSTGAGPSRAPGQVEVGIIVHGVFNEELATKRRVRIGVADQVQKILGTEGARTP